LMSLTGLVGAQTVTGL